MLLLETSYEALSITAMLQGRSKESGISGTQGSRAASVRDRHLLCVDGPRKAPWSQCYIGANIRLGITFRRRAELFITLRPVCRLSLSFVALQPHLGRFW